MNDIKLYVVFLNLEKAESVLCITIHNGSINYIGVYLIYICLFFFGFCDCLFVCFYVMFLLLQNHGDVY